MGLTASAQPTLTWFLPDDDSVPLEFSVYTIEPSGDYGLIHLQMLPYTPGINQYQLPVELAPDTRYLWQLVLQCNPNRPSSALIYEAELEFVPPVENAIAEGSPVLELSKTYAKAGYWYDAISVLGPGQQSDVADMRAALLNDLVLAEAALDSSNSQ